MLASPLFLLTSQLSFLFFFIFMTKGNLEVIIRALLVVNAFVIEYFAYQWREVTDGSLSIWEGPVSFLSRGGISERVIFNL